ncbi:hypothetical protein NC653_037820 [Populus alba x Populus x berolinensis]|uniref:Uncharacterized protein n=1 Tax=Populus alba x Populus x berolinensis TaxID=444605 RepID=A0AAD6LFH4_9ROSI|nr:hypothetical protein NC653_037820 [Populus alba x Populus x berolinensis]
MQNHHGAIKEKPVTEELAPQSRRSWPHSHVASDVPLAMVHVKEIDSGSRLKIGNMSPLGNLRVA